MGALKLIFSIKKLDMFQGSVGTKFQVSIVFPLVKGSGKDRHPDTHINLGASIRISPTDYAPETDLIKRSSESIPRAYCTPYNPLAAASSTNGSRISFAVLNFLLSYGLL